MSHAIVIGSSVAGLLAAAALSRTFDSVTLVERDASPSAPTPRKGAPQGKHNHALLQAGENAIEELLPGTRAALLAQGAHAIDFGRDAAWFHYGVWKRRHTSGFIVHTASRPLLESVLATAVAKLPGVTIRRGEQIEGLVFGDLRERVVGVRIAGERVPADAVVDASGRGSHAERWLESAGFSAPPATRIRPNLRYSSREYRATKETDGGWKLLIVYPEPPKEARLGLIFPIEGGRWMVTLGGWRGEHPPDDDEGFVRFAKSLAHPALHDAIASAEPLTAPVLHPFPEAVWRRWDRAAKTPKGFVVVGDAACSFDPVFGQGMAVAALEAKNLARHLARDPKLERPRELFQSQAKIIATPWLLSTSENLRFAETVGERAPLLGALQAYTSRVFKLCETDLDVHQRFLRVLNLVDGPEALFAPSVIAKVLRSTFGGGRAEAELGPVPTPLELAAGE